MAALIEIAGGIASGKTTLLRAISSGSAAVVYEDHTKNPFWQDFYSEPGHHVFETEVSFLLQHYHYAKVGLSQNNIVALDHSLELDLAYSRVGLNGSRQEIFDQIYKEIRAELGPPSVLIWVHCRPKEALRRIEERGRKFESNIDLQFLTAIDTELELVITQRAETDAYTLIELDAEKIDFRVSGDWVVDLVGDLCIA